MEIEELIKTSVKRTIKQSEKTRAILENDLKTLAAMDNQIDNLKNRIGEYSKNLMNLELLFK